MDKGDIDTLKLAVATIFEPSSSPHDRLRAQQICENFKESSPHCIQCGLLLADRQNSPIIRHFGLKLLEHCTKYRWNSLTNDEKQLLKANSLQLISEGTGDILVEELHIKDAVSRLVVEILKHEWPNNWTSLMGDLYQLCISGPTQTELVMMVFLRLIEDVITFQNLQTLRRREIVNALNVNIAEIFELFVNLLQEHSNSAINLENRASPALETNILQHYRVSVSTLATLNGYLDWVAMSHIVIKDNLLLEMLCLLLGNAHLKLGAAECLLTIVGKRGKIDERRPLLILFQEGALSTIWNAAVSAGAVSKNEHFYIFLQKLCQILVELGNQLCFLLGSSDINIPQNFDKYLEAVLAFTQHSSQMLSGCTFHLWSLFMRNEQISQDPSFTKILPCLVQTGYKKLLKVGYPSQNNSPSCEYSRFDFDHDEEFSFFFSKFRAEVAEMVRQVTLLQPTVSFTFACTWLRELLEKPLNTGDEKCGSICNLHSPSYLEWEALTLFFENVMSRLNLEKMSTTDTQDGVQLLKTVLVFNMQDPLLLSCLLSCISSLFIYLKFTPDILPQLLQKIFSAVIFHLPGQTKATRSRAVKNVRQHACSVLVKICKEYPSLVFPVFGELCDHCKSISSDPDQLSQMENCILTEALILVSNQYDNFEKQSAFLDEVLKPVKDLWSSEEFKTAFWSTDKFMSYVGLDQAPVEPSSKDTCGINRSHISYCMQMILAVIKRSTWPQDVQVARNGGFILHEMEGSDPVMRNPATPHISALLENVFALLKSMNMLFCEDFLRLRHPEFAKAYDMLNNDVQTFLGIQPPIVDNSGTANYKQPLQRMQHFLTQSYDTCCHILGNAGQFLGSEFYALPDLARTIVDTAMSNLNVVTDYRLRSIIRIFLKSYIQHCPSQYYESAVLPVLAHICPFMHVKLGQRWIQINQQCESRTPEDEENQAEQEILEEYLSRFVTREYLELLCIVCFKKSGNVEDVTMEKEEEAQPPPTYRELGLLGKLCMSSERICEPLVLCVFSGLGWLDTHTCNKCLSLVIPLLKQLISDQNISGSAAHHFFTGTLLGLNKHGAHEGIASNMVNLSLQVYELLRPLFPEVANAMLQVPSCDQNSIQQFDDKFLGAQPTQKVQEKKKKDAFKKLINGCIGKTTANLFKRDVQYKSLPNLFRKNKPRMDALDDTETKDIGLCELFKPEPNGR
ncbi:exportin-5-like [Mya arenaria]|uniref:exportin-5-like n=1 Tax=Mya arenaria TaxID=6604 RepID=UPI0022E69957|nr:exportin-5-like [Mya arenaria]